MKRDHFSALDASLWPAGKTSPKTRPDASKGDRKFCSTGDGARLCRVSIIVKALNEEQHIASTLESALRAVRLVGGEVILADSHSSDRTVEIARRYPVRIVQLRHPAERRCGVGPQLGFAHARGEFIYLVDGDMQLAEGFLPQALAFMHGRTEIAGVSGRVREMHTDTHEYLAREEQWAAVPTGLASRLDGGGLYRRRAIESVAYLSNRNLHSYEEFDLAARLRCEGWDLWRLPIDAVSHYGHETPPYTLLLKRWRSGYIWGLGELLRANLGMDRLPLVLREVRELRLYAAVLVWWLALLALPWLTFLPLTLGQRLAAELLLMVFPVALMSWRKRSFARGLYALTSWCMHAAGMVRGFARKPVDPQQPIASCVLQEAGYAPAPAAASARMPVAVAAAMASTAPLQNGQHAS